MDNYVTIKDMPSEERPREKMVKYGASTLSTAELLALILRTGSKKRTALDLANKLLTACGGIKCLIDLSIEELQQIKGVGLAKSSQLKAVAELSKRLLSAHSDLNKISSPEDIAQFMIPKLKDLHQESFQIVLLNTKNEIIGVREVFRGSLNNSIVHPREVFRPAIKKSSAAIILAHNHPSGDVTPSQEDIEVTKRLSQVGELVGIEVLDHLVIGVNDYFSLKAKNLF
ncbi:DNA repair protein RadC [Natroniella sulfidigena]|uniref:RadC family protein n=1 Tax=Natroniella sulfidigena TaxID=723921 RepID=UPI00200A887B|nr:DNA repair protein RadC [Natroniella sulfidigena]MCK8815868.1 DNA repair protein RadC [Natroniella sulfidigena]